MSEIDPPRRSPRFERGLEQIIYSSRWLMAPVYLGLVVALGVLTISFFRELWVELPHLLSMEEKDVVLLVLSLLDISLAGNLVLIILFSGYENFVSKIETARDDRDRPEWLGTVDFSGLKVKLIASIVAISGIHLLKVFLNLPEYPREDLIWYVAIHATFVLSGVAVAAMDWIEEKAHKVGGH